jgi:DNA ligase (NAD+)
MITLDQYCELPGYDIKSAEMLKRNTASAAEMYDTIKAYITFAKEEILQLGVGVFSGQVIVATGVRLSPELQEKIALHGGVVSESFNKQTTILVTKDVNSTSGKAQKAKDLGIKVISLETLLSMV